MVIRARVAPRAEPVFAESERNLVERGRPRRRGPAHSEGARSTDEEPRHHAVVPRTAKGRGRPTRTEGTALMQTESQAPLTLNAEPPLPPRPPHRP
jgi:hypothetical protein